MLPELEMRFTALEEERHRVLEALTAASSAQLSFQPAAGGWSLLEVAEHMVRVEEAVALQLAKSETVAQSRSLGQWFRHKLVRFWLAVGLRAQAPGRMRPQGWDLARLRERWESVRQQLREYLDTVTEADLGRLAARHPVAGPVTVADSVTFLEGHFRHHLRQMARVRASAGFPES
jgi:uncharacterized damage-inducible protein DinB